MVPPVEATSIPVAESCNSCQVRPFCPIWSLDPFATWTCLVTDANRSASGNGSGLSSNRSTTV
jgi:hypothetical protein